ncbi:MAG: RluA family pseudouridine synthase, partial [Anaerolineae bacterium]|nr:RluA family pseudouridine synthase [Anaerolineae bacterium]
MPVTKPIEFVNETPGERLDKIVVARLGEGFSRAHVQKLIDDGNVSVDGEWVKAGIKLKGGEFIRIAVPPQPPQQDVRAENIPLKIVYEDADIAVIDKPAGLIVHPGAGNEHGTMVNALLARYPEIEQIPIAPKRRGIVHRLDKDTSGLMVVAKSDRAHQGLAAQFADHGRTGPLQRAYLAFVWGAPPRRAGTIE